MVHRITKNCINHPSEFFVEKSYMGTVKYLALEADIHANNNETVQQLKLVKYLKHFNSFQYITVHSQL